MSIQIYCRAYTNMHKHTFHTIFQYTRSQVALVPLKSVRGNKDRIDWLGLCFKYVVISPSEYL